MNPVDSYRRLLRCDMCEHEVVCTMADMVAYARKGWPTCCDDVMTLFIEIGKPHTTGENRPIAAQPPAFSLTGGGNGT
jgi:hypothetical protein